MAERKIHASGVQLTTKAENVEAVLHRLYCDCGKELMLPQGIWHKSGFKWHYKCDCGIQFQTSLVFPRIEFVLRHDDGKLDRFNSSGYYLGTIPREDGDKG